MCKLCFFINRFNRVSAALVAALGLTSLSSVMADGDGTFSLYDTDRDGYLNKEEFEQFAERKRSQPDIADIWVFERVDTDGDNRISGQEMVDALLEQLKRKRQQ